MTTQKEQHLQTTDHLYTPKEVAELLQINMQTVLRFIREGKIKAIKVGRSYRISESNYNLYINKQ